MTTKYLARLQFRPDGSTVEGEWTRASTAHDRYTQWVGLFSKDPAVAVSLIEDADGQQRVLRTWTSRGEIIPPSP